MYSHVRFVYIVFTLACILILVFYGNKMSKAPERRYWRLAIMPIVTYTLYMGLRFGRMIDYNVYYFRYCKLGKDIAALDYEPLFRLICHTFNRIGIPYQGFILFCAFMMIFSICFWLKKWRQAMPWMFLVFFWECLNVENYIRWYLAVSFVLIALTYFMESKNQRAIIFAVCAVLIHIGVLPVLLLLLLLSKINFVILPTYLSQILIVAAVTIGETKILAPLNDIVMLLGVDSRTEFYASQFNDLINGDLGKIGMRDALKITAQIRIILSYSFALYWIKKLIEEKKLTSFVSNAYIFGIIAAPIFNKVEILDRFASFFLMFSIIVSGTVYYNFFKNRHKYNLAWNAFFILSVVCTLSPIITGLFYRTEWYEVLFIWDAAGRETLPLRLFR